MDGYCFEKSGSTSFSSRSSSGDDDQPINRKLPVGTAPAAGLAWVAPPAAGAVVAAGAAGADVADDGCDCVGPHAASKRTAEVRTASQRLVRIRRCLPGSVQALPDMPLSHHYRPVTGRCQSRERATGTDKPRRPVAVPEGAHLYTVGLVDGVHKSTIAQVDANVTQAATVGVGEHQHVAGSEVVGVDALATGQLACLVVRHRHTELAVDPHHKAGTVEASGRRAAPSIRTAHVR